jgi:hypothetical protein
MSVKKILDDFGKRVVKESRSTLTRKKKRDKGNLYDSIKYDLTVSKNSFNLKFPLADYWEFVDQGVQGVSSSAKAPSSPFKFGTGTGVKGGLTNAIDGWTRRKRIQFKDRKTGRFLSYTSTAFLIRRAIWHKGLETTNFFNKPFERAFQRLPDEVVNAYALEIEDLLKFTTKK